MPPLVSFVVPCYKLANLLPDCVNSILSQTYGDLEVIIMDDCSPDQTPDVARSFGDTRVKHVRNEVNLGHLQNYNKGIALARGEYVWLISADDFLRRPYILGRYVHIMERHPDVGYVFSPAMKFQDGHETEVVSWSAHADQDVIFKGHEFLRKLVVQNCVVAPTGMVRKKCYEQISLFPLNMPNSGDWYLWCVFALHYDVAYVAEPMVCYRIHGNNMSENLKRHEPAVITNDNFAVRWTLKQKAEAIGAKSVTAHCKDAIATYYANLVASHMYEKSIYRATLEECQASIQGYARDKDEEREIRAEVLAALGDQCYLQRDFEQARQCYAWSLELQPCAIGTRMKHLLLNLGRVGVRCRDYAAAII